MPAPSNDNFASAIALSTTLPGLRSDDTLVDATSQASEEGTWPAATDKQSVWYTFTPTTTGRYRFAITGITAAGSDTPEIALYVYSGSALGSLTELVRFRNNASGSLFPNGMSVVLELTASTTYRIQVFAPLFSGETGNEHVSTYDLSWEQVTVGTAPANDNLANVEDLGSNPADGNYPGSVDSATFEGFEGTAGYNQPSVWFRFAATVTETQEIHVVAPGTNPFYAPYYEIYRIDTDPPTDFTDLTFIDSGLITFGVDSFDCKRNVSLVSGDDYLIYVSNYHWNGEWDDFTLVFGTYTAPAPPANDDRADLLNSPLAYYHPWYLGRTEWVDSPGSSWWTQAEAGAVDGTTVLATAEGGEAARAGFAATRSVWYVLDIARAGDYRIWVESAVDCVLGVYNKPVDNSLGTLIDDDDDSGTGNWPEVTVNLGVGDYWVVVDSKTEGTFRLKWERVATGTPPANDDFASATVISSLPYSASGTTVDATAEPDERNAELLALGPKDSVWYKYVATADGQITVRATCDTNNNDAYVYVDVWKGTTLTGLTRATEPPRDFPVAFFSYFDTPEELDAAVINVNVVNGQTYYIRVQTESGGSEGFTVYVDAQVIYLDLQISGSEEMHGTLLDDAEVYLNLQHTGVEVYHDATSEDAATVSLLLTPITTWETQGQETTDSATVYLDLTVLGGECFSRFHFTGEGEADARWGIVSDLVRWLPDDQVRWTALVEQQPGCE